MIFSARQKIFSFEDREIFSEESEMLSMTVSQGEIMEAVAPAEIPAMEVITLDARAERIRKLQADVQRGIIEIGQELIAAKKEIGHGGWGDWLKKEFDWTDRTARNFMAVAERFGNRKTFSDLKPSTLQAMLRLPSGDEEDFIKAQADAGKPIENQSAREVQSAVKEFKQTKEAIVSEPPMQIAENKPLITNCTGNNEWYTPAEYIEAARRVMGGIDLDPASCAIANEVIRAEKFFSLEEDGLKKDWSGRIWLNPPYSRELIGKFVDKLLASDFEAAIVLTDAATETSWFSKLAQKAAVICFATRRIKFLRPDGSPGNGNPTRGSAFFYFGIEAEKFCELFQQFGWCAKKYDLYAVSGSGYNPFETKQTGRPLSISDSTSPEASRQERQETLWANFFLQPKPLNSSTSLSSLSNAGRKAASSFQKKLVSLLANAVGNWYQNTPKNSLNWYHSKSATVGGCGSWWA